MAKAAKHNPGKGHKVMKGAPQGAKGNLKLPNPSQAMHVSGKKDTMAGNVGGSQAHMETSAKSLGHQDLIETGSNMKGPKKTKEKY